jgi:uncharacterized membrane protein YdbT with pleckstrin-like domain
VPYPEKILADDEQVVEHLHPHWGTLVPAALWFLVICGAGGAGIGFSHRLTGTGHEAVLIAIVVIGIVLLSRLSVVPWISWRTTHYVFTSHRVLIRRGVLRHEGRDIALQRINDVGFSQSLWERIVKSGTLTIESAGEHGQETLHNIPRSDQAQQTLNRLVEQDADRRARQVYGPPPGQPAGYPPNQPYPGYSSGYPTQRQ